MTTSDHPLLPPEVQEEFRRLGLWEDLTLADVVADWATRHPDRPAVIGPHEVTYGELWEQARAASPARSPAAGLRQGDYLLAVLPSRWQGIVLRSPPRARRAPLVGHSPVSSTLARNLVDQLGDPRDRAARPTCSSSASGAPALDEPARWADGRAGRRGGGAERPPLEEAAATGSPLAEPTDVDPGAPCIVLSTGGTTGVPKSILHCSRR